MDVVHVLHANQQLQQCLGRAVPESDESVSQVDEFGRHIKSQQEVDRERRFVERESALTRITESPYKDDDVKTDVSSTLMSPSNQEEYQQRLDALQGALDVVLEQVDESYLSLKDLIQVFQQWSQKYPQDYSNCFADLSLGDMASILVQVDLVKSPALPSQKESAKVIKSAAILVVYKGSFIKSAFAYAMIGQ